MNQKDVKVGKEIMVDNREDERVREIERVRKEKEEQKA